MSARWAKFGATDADRKSLTGVAQNGILYCVSHAAKQLTQEPMAHAELRTYSNDQEEGETMLSIRTCVPSDWRPPLSVPG